MASITGNAGVVEIDGSSIAQVRGYSIEMTSDTIENTTMDPLDSGRTYLKGLTTFSGSADIYWDPTDFSTADLDGLINNDVGDATSSVVLKVYHSGAAGSYWTGNIIVTGYSLSASFDGMIEASLSFQGNGQLSYTVV